ncbi:MAG: hypothetical protein K2J48_11210, partial [Muribaculaceae bacterium]|nr:hypothetical protein [Muribaculaceae bacterium]
MKKQYLTIPLRSRSLTDDFLSADGEVDSASNLLPLSAYLHDKEGAYTEIFHPDFILPRQELPRVEATLLRTTLPGWHIHPEEFPAKNVVSTDTSSEARGKCALSLLNRFRDEAAGKNLFTEPFLFLAAFRLKDGRHISPTPPILLIPNSAAPLVALSGNAEDEEMRLSVIAAICKLQVRITFPDDADYSDLPVAALDLFVTTPFSLYDSKTIPLAMRHIPFSGFTHSLSPDGLAGEHPLTTVTVPAGWLPKATPGGELSYAIASAYSFHRISSIPFKSLTPTTSFQDIVFNSGSPLSSPYPEYTPDYLHLSSVEKTEGAEFDGSSSFVNINVTPPSPLPLN